ncbi:MAG: ATP-binding domain-containing protein, partial [Bacteroidales bacterium]
EICAADRVMIVKNNYSWIPENEKLNFLANGDIATLRRIGKYEERYGYRFLNVDLELPDYANYELSCKVLLNTLSMESPSLSSEQSKDFFFAVAQDYAHLHGPDRWKAVRADPFYSAVQIKFAYAVTCHKAQGGQWKAVYVDQGWFADDMLNREYLRWLYTAVTRPVEQLYLVNFDPRFLQHESTE